MSSLIVLSIAVLHATAYVLQFIHQVKNNTSGDTITLALTNVEIRSNLWHSITKFSIYTNQLLPFHN